MNDITRFSVTIPKTLLEEFNQRVAGTGRKNRSEVMRSLMRRYISEERWKTDEGEVYGTVTLIYDHHLPNLTRELTEAQHDHGEMILCSTHVHISHSTCLECIIMKGASSKIQRFCEALERIRGIQSLDTVIMAAPA